MMRPVDEDLHGDVTPWQAPCVGSEAHPGILLLPLTERQAHGT